ncbi:class I SAM-dependent methyltransferase [Pleomorphomonas koreensis]|uniref:class I SAM-dependent methyltransferase n=1 Tax=Pleomorphomonas koreensis TaxID=257440 RepID=UPI0004245D8F|nr:SAM-dependent methyltransferase [Pleomorphomonas koreensis]
MRYGFPMQTSQVTAAIRAAHQTHDDGRVFRDPFAEDILGPEAAPLTMGLPGVPGYHVLRFLMPARSRYAEDALAEAVERGCRQMVILGAGLDTFSLRNPYRRLGLAVFEVDRAAAQADKRRRLLRLGPHLPAGLSLVPAEIGGGDLAAALSAAGWRADQPTFFEMLGVAVYLPVATTLDLLRFIAGLPRSEVVLDYTVPPHSQSPEGRAVTEAMTAELAASGEPWVGFFEPAELAAALRQIGLSDVEDLDIQALRHRYLGEPAAGGGEWGSHVVRARRPD